MSSSPHADNIRKAEEAIGELRQDMKKVAETTTTLVAQGQFTTKEIERCNDLHDKLSERVASELKSISESLNGIALRLQKIEQDMNQLKSWKDDSKKERDESARRFWAFGPNITAAIITIVLAPLTVLFWNYLIPLLFGVKGN
jgi:uncharacterized coiled-coil DUF342 family protein